jgi:Pectate lyase superfamily protein
MKRCVLSALAVTLSLISSAHGQALPTFPRSVPRPGTEPEIRTRVIFNPVFATGMKCDGLTDDSAALQAALTSAAIPGLGNATVIMPPGTCIIDPGASVRISSSIWLQGAGRFGTTLKRKNSSSGSPMLLISSSGVTLSDFAFDGNKGGPGIASPSDSVTADRPVSKLTIQRMRFANSTNSDVASYVRGAGNFPTDWLVADSDFDNQGNPYSDCAVSFACANLFIQQPLRLRITGNRSDTSQNFAFFSSYPGGGQVEVGQNIITNIEGFGIALGGGTLGSAGAHIHHNYISSVPTEQDNLVDLAFWSDFTVDHNLMHYTGGFPSSIGLPTSCIADAPPANHGDADANTCYITPIITTNVVGISLGGSDISITNNFVQGATTAGISVDVYTAGPSRGVRVIGNTTKNNSQQTPGSNAGIGLYLQPGGPNLAAISDVIIRGNHSYDDQAIQTQGYGIGIALAGQATGYSNIIIEGNDLTGNLHGGIQNNASPFTGFVIRNNPGQNPVGAITAPAFPASGAGSQINNTGYDVTLYITSGTNPITIAINGTTLTGVSVAGGGAVSGPIRLPANQNITLTYAAGGTPSWQWIAD